MRSIRVITTIMLAIAAIVIVGAAFQLTQAQQPPRGPAAFRMIQAVENTWAAIAFEVKVDNATLEKARPHFQKAWDERKKLMRDSAGDFRTLVEGMRKIKARLDEKLKTVLTEEQMKRLAEWEKSQQRRPPMGGPRRR
jgi:transcription termination factor NusB